MQQYNGESVESELGEAIGYAFDNNQLITQHDLLAFFNQSDNWEAFKERAARITGEWAVELHRNGEVWCAVDRHSSHRLYYRVVDGELKVRENGYDLLQDNDVMNDEVRTFFLRWGYTPAETTLVREINKLPSAHALRWHDGQALLEAYDTIDEINVQAQPAMTYDEAKARLIDLLRQATQRMIKVLNGRRAIITLTAGYDSRLILTLLSEANYDAIEIISYGKPGNRDAVEAEKIAKQVGLPFKFINSVKESAVDYTADQSFYPFMRNMTGLSSGYFYQEFQPARWLEKEFDDDEEVNAMILHGQWGDVLGGSQLKLTSLESKNLNNQALSRIIYHRLIANQAYSGKSKRQVQQQQTATLNHFGGTNMPAYQRYEWYLTHEEKDKYYLNSQHSWRFFDLPTLGFFLDRELYQFLLSLPFEYRFGSVLYNDVCETLFQANNIPGPTYDSTLEQLNNRRYQIKQQLKPYIQRWIPPHPLFEYDTIGFEKLMKHLVKEVKQSKRYHPLTVNGYSFAWYLLRLDKLLSQLRKSDD